MGTRPWVGRSYVRSGSDYPAVYVSWEDAQEFIGRLNARADSVVYRLPSEAEWEYACRAGTTTRWSFGDDESQLTHYAWYRDNAWDVGERYAHSVGTKRPNPWGLYDMHGNVWEWVQDWYAADYYSRSPSVDPTGPSTGSDRVIRGRSFHDAQGVRSAYRDSRSPGYRSAIGFRLLRQVDGVGTGGNGGSDGGTGGNGGGTGGNGSTDSGEGGGDGVLVTGITQLTHGTRDYSPICSPDSRFIAFLSLHAQPRRYHRIDSDGSNRIHELTHHGSTDSDSRPLFSWSPDGRSIVFEARDEGDNSDIWVASSDGSNRIQLTFNPGYDASPTYSPDGRFIAFTSGRDGGGIYRMDSDGSNQTRLIKDNKDFFVSTPTYSPDGRFIAFVGVHPAFGATSTYIYRIDSDGSNLTQLSTGPVDGDPQWSPDGRFIAFCSGRDGFGHYLFDHPTHIYVMDSDGSNKIQLTITDGVQHSTPDWSPDGRFIAFSSFIYGPTEIYRIDIEYGPIEKNKIILTFPDAGLVAALIRSLNKQPGTASITVGDMATLQSLSGQSSNIHDLNRPGTCDQPDRVESSEQPYLRPHASY